MTHGPEIRGRALALGVVAAGCLLLGACSKSPRPTTEAITDLRADVQKTVTDPARASQALAALDSVSALVPVVADFQSRTSDELRTLLRNYDAPRADFDAATARWEIERAQVRSRALAAHEAFKQALTDDEWKKLQGPERKIVFQYPVVHTQGATQGPGGGR